MGVGDGGHRVDLEVLVGGNVGGVLDWSPVGEGWLGIVEVLVGDTLDVVVVDGSNSLGNLASWNSSSNVHDLVSNFVVDSLIGLVDEQVVKEGGSSSDDFDVVEVMGINGWQVNTAEVHLSGEDLVTVEVVSENTSIRVGKVMAVSSGNIWEHTKKGMHGVVLLLAVIEMLSIFIDSIGSEKVLEKTEGVVVFISGRWSIIEDTDV